MVSIGTVRAARRGRCHWYGVSPKAHRLPASAPITHLQMTKRWSLWSGGVARPQYAEPYEPLQWKYSAWRQSRNVAARARNGQSQPHVASQAALRVDWQYCLPFPCRARCRQGELWRSLSQQLTPQRSVGADQQVTSGSCPRKRADRFPSPRHPAYVWCGAAATLPRSDTTLLASHRRRDLGRPRTSGGCTRQHVGRTEPSTRSEPPMLWCPCSICLAPTWRLVNLHVAELPDESARWPLEVCHGHPRL